MGHLFEKVSARVISNWPVCVIVKTVLACEDIPADEGDSDGVCRDVLMSLHGMHPVIRIAALATIWLPAVMLWLLWRICGGRCGNFVKHAYRIVHGIPGVDLIRVFTILWVFEIEGRTTGSGR